MFLLYLTMLMAFANGQNEDLKNQIFMLDMLIAYNLEKLPPESMALQFSDREAALEKRCHYAARRYGDLTRRMEYLQRRMEIAEDTERPVLENELARLRQERDVYRAEGHEATRSMYTLRTERDFASDAFRAELDIARRVRVQLARIELTENQLAGTHHKLDPVLGMTPLDWTIVYPPDFAGCAQYH